jgi:hypothetical protein
MVSLAIRPRSRQVSADDEQLLKLFWNRAELKKEFAELRRDRDQLRDQVRQQEEKQLKVQQKLERLEGMLSDPEKSANASVFYQLRGIWHHCHKLLMRLATDLSAHQVELEKNRELLRIEAELRAALEGFEGRLSIAQTRACGIEHEVSLVREEHARLRGFWNAFKRRGLKSRLEILSRDLVVAQGQVERLRKELAEAKQDTTREFKGLSLGGKRKVNVAIVALAQELCLHFTAHDIGTMARDAIVRHVSEINYGDIQVCRRLSREIQKVFLELSGVDDFSARVQRRAKWLAGNATYRRESDTVAVAGSFATIPLEISSSGGVLSEKAFPTNVLADEYWDVYKVLLT